MGLSITVAVASTALVAAQQDQARQTRYDAKEKANQLADAQQDAENEAKEKIAQDKALKASQVNSSVARQGQIQNAGPSNSTILSSPLGSTATASPTSGNKTVLGS